MIGIVSLDKGVSSSGLIYSHQTYFEFFGRRSDWKKVRLENISPIIEQVDHPTGHTDDRLSF